MHFIHAHALIHLRRPHAGFRSWNLATNAGNFNSPQENRASCGKGIIVDDDQMSIVADDVELPEDFPEGRNTQLSEPEEPQLIMLRSVGVIEAAFALDLVVQLADGFGVPVDADTFDVISNLTEYRAQPSDPMGGLNRIFIDGSSGVDPMDDTYGVYITIRDDILNERDEEELDILPTFYSYTAPFEDSYQYAYERGLRPYDDDDTRQVYMYDGKGLIINNDRSTIAFVDPNVSAAEEAVITFTVRQVTAITNGWVASWSVAPDAGDNTKPELYPYLGVTASVIDVFPQSGTIPFDGFQGEEHTIVLTVVGDNLVERSFEGLRLQVLPQATPMFYTSVPDAITHYLLLENTDKVTIDIWADDVFEGDDVVVYYEHVGDVTYEVPFTIDVFTVGGTATDDVDYESYIVTLAFSGIPNQGVRSFTFATANLDGLEPNEFFFVDYSFNSPGQFYLEDTIIMSTLQVNIIDTDPVDVVASCVGSPGEPGGNITVELSFELPDFSNGIEFVVEAVGGTADVAFDLALTSISQSYTTMDYMYGESIVGAFSFPIIDDINWERAAETVEFSW